MRSRIFSLDRFSRYAVMGAVANLVGYALFVALVLLAGIAPVISSGIAYVVTLTGSYIANRSWAFQSQNAHSRDVPRYLAAYGVGLFVALGAMHLMGPYIHPALAQILIIGIAAGAVYSTLELLRFGRASTSDTELNS